MKANAMSELARVAKTIDRLVRPGMKPKELIAAVRKKHPNISKKEITRAAFYAVIVAAEQKSDRVSDLHDMAVRTRNSPDETPLDDR
ncbi:hypothetical protein [Rhizobium etli]|uniref:hypothetical protein n=1 Tax=Rhizobium etli TaxID=29449 RepID=UPI000409C8A2|nr:hypothetical protein [Rhizobium etli]